MRGDAGELGLHVLEQRAFRLRAQIFELQTVMRGRHGVDHLHHGAGIGQDVLARGVEELEGQGDMRIVDIMDLGQIGDVRRAVRCAGRDHRGYGALEAVAELAERGSHDRAASGCPAAGPGVCSKAALGTKVTATTSPSMPAMIACRNGSSKPIVPISSAKVRP